MCYMLRATYKMPNIRNLFDEKYVTDLFTKKILPLYPDFKKIDKIVITAPKKLIWEHTYHVVIEFFTTFENKEGKKISLPIYCTAHSDEPRKNVFVSLKYLWDHGFSGNNLTIPHPLFYSNEFKGTFYRGVEGRNLYQYIREGNLEEIEKIIPKTANWFARLHNLPTETAKNFNKNNSRIATVFPGHSHTTQRIQENYPEYLSLYKNAYKHFITKENGFLNKTTKRWLVHGDAHPENVIKMSERKIAIIDFTDLSLTDFARDLGTFTQQLEYMVNRKINKSGYSEELNKLFLNNYFKNVNIKLDDNLRERINLYYHWTAIRTASFFLLKHTHEPERAEELIKKIENYLKNT